MHEFLLWKAPWRIAVIAGTAFLVSVVTWSYQEFREPEAHGRMVRTLVIQELNALKEGPLPDSSLLALKGWPNDFLTLQSWITVKLAQTSDYDGIARDLKKMARGRSLSPVMLTSLSRWDHQLRTWASETKKPHEPQSAHSLLSEGRFYYVEATGYDKIGEDYDGTVLYMRAIYKLSQFIIEHPKHDNVPEALFLLGQSLVRLKYALPAASGGDRILNLCSELFPDSIWGKRAKASWRKGII